MSHKYPYAFDSTMPPPPTAVPTMFIPPPFPKRKRIAGLRRVKRAVCVRVRQALCGGDDEYGYGAYDHGVESSDDGCEDGTEDPRDTVGALDGFSSQQREHAEIVTTFPSTSNAIRARLRQDDRPEKVAVNYSQQSRPRMSWLRPVTLPPVTLAPSSASEILSFAVNNTVNHGSFESEDMSSAIGHFTNNDRFMSATWQAPRSADEEEELLNAFLKEVNIAPSSSGTKTSLDNSEQTSPSSSPPAMPVHSLSPSKRGTSHIKKKQTEDADIDQYNSPILRSITFKKNDGEIDEVDCREEYASVLKRMVEPLGNMVLFGFEGPRVKEERLVEEFDERSMRIVRVRRDERRRRTLG